MYRQNQIIEIMTSDKLEVNAKIQIQKPIGEVFEAIVNPEKMSNYFIASSSGRMEVGEELTWWFPEFEEGFPIRVGKIEKDKYVSYYWEMEDHELLVEIELSSEQGGQTVVKITEREMENNAAGMKWLKGNTEGWANFLACLKAYLEYGINLRKGAFDFLTV